MTAPPQDAPKTSASVAEAEPEPRLRLVPGVAAGPAPGTLERTVAFVRAVRRDMARLLRGMHASERPLSTLPQTITTRLAHLDAQTARFLGDPAPERAAHAEAAARDMRAMERWLVRHLSGRELAEVRAQELRIRVGDEELVRPLVCLDEPLGASAGPPGADEGPRSLRRGLTGLDNAALAEVCRRLGVRAPEGPTWRGQAEREVEARLRDGQLLAVLVATLSQEAQSLLAAMIRGHIGRATWRRLLAPAPPGAADGGAPLLAAAESPADALQACALAFPEPPERGPGLWAPVELVRRLDGLLRSMGT